MMIEPRRPTPRGASSREYTVRLRVDHIELQGITIRVAGDALEHDRFRIPGLLASASTRPGVASAGLTARMWIMSRGSSNRPPTTTRQSLFRSRTTPRAVNRDSSRWMQERSPAPVAPMTTAARGGEARPRSRRWGRRGPKLAPAVRRGSSYVLPDPRERDVTRIGLARGSCPPNIREPVSVLPDCSPFRRRTLQSAAPKRQLHPHGGMRRSENGSKLRSRSASHADRAATERPGTSRLSIRCQHRSAREVGPR